MKLSIPKTPLFVHLSTTHIVAFGVVTFGCVLVDPYGEGNPLSGVGLFVWWLLINATCYLSGELIVQNVFRFRDPSKRPFLTILLGALAAATFVGGNVSLLVLVMSVILDIPFGFWLTFKTVSKMAFLIAVGRLFFFRQDALAVLLQKKEADARAMERAVSVSSEETKRGEEPESALSQRIPAYLGDNILYMRSQDHYVEVVTDKGNHLIKMRFRDAIDEVEPLQGLQIHRGCWVRHSAVVRAKTHNRRLLIQTSDGTQHPVSRSFVSAVRAKMRL